MVIQIWRESSVRAWTPCCDIYEGRPILSEIYITLCYYDKSAYSDGSRSFIVFFETSCIFVALHQFQSDLRSSEPSGQLRFTLKIVRVFLHCSIHCYFLFWRCRKAKLIISTLPASYDAPRLLLTRQKTSSYPAAHFRTGAFVSCLDGRPHARICMQCSKYWSTEENVRHSFAPCRVAHFHSSSDVHCQPASW